LDSTNVVRPVVTAITSIGLDHEQFLGSDLRSIAAEKAGILKDGVPCVVGIMPPEARSVILAHSLRCGAEIHDPVSASPSDSEPQWIAQTRGISLKILELLSEETRLLSGLDFKASRARAVLAGTPSDWGLRGRWEWVGPPDTAAQPWALVDCAHNADGLRASLQKLRELGRPLRIVFASVVDKNLTAALELLPAEAQYHFCAADLPRALDPSRLAAQASTYGLAGTAHPPTLKKTSVESAVESALNARTGDELLVVLGSIFIAGPALEALGAS
jgi:dihydrofolate synthase/folylpolyglutamate synthase